MRHPSSTRRAEQDRLSRRAGVKGRLRDSAPCPHLRLRRPVDSAALQSPSADPGCLVSTGARLIRLFDAGCARNRSAAIPDAVVVGQSWQPRPRCTNGASGAANSG